LARFSGVSGIGAFETTVTIRPSTVADVSLRTPVLATGALSVVGDCADVSAGGAGCVSAEAGAPWLISWAKARPPIKLAAAAARA
jgi:hypothetical protein